MHCNSAYPTPLEDVNLNVLKTFKKNFDCRIGFSDHTKSIECSLGAIALGATVIEKHLTLNKKMKGPDHKTSLDPSEFKTLVKKIRNLEIALGNSDKQITKSAKKNKNLMMRSIYSSKTIKKGELFNHTNITTKRPFNGGISPDKYFKLIKKKAKFSYKINQKINLKEL